MLYGNAWLSLFALTVRNKENTRSRIPSSTQAKEKAHL
jgi:hypothetical protein